MRFVGGHNNSHVGPDPLNWPTHAVPGGDTRECDDSPCSLPVAPHPLPRFSYGGCGWSGLRSSKVYKLFKSKNNSHCFLKLT